MTTFNAQPITLAEALELKSSHGEDFEQPDWGQSLTEINAGLRTLQDAFPRSNVEDVQAGYQTVQRALHDMRRFLLLRGVEVL